MDRSGEYLFAGNRSTLGTYENSDPSRRTEAVRGNSMHAHDAAFSPFSRQAPPLSRLNSNQTGPYKYLPTSDINEYQPNPCQGSTINHFHDSGYRTVTGNYLTQPSLPTQPGLSNVTQPSVAYTQSEINFEDPDWFEKWLAGPEPTQPGVENTQQSLNPMHDRPDSTKITSVVPRKKKKRTSSWSSNSLNDARRPKKRSKQSASYLIGASFEQELKLQQQLSEWELKSRLPSEKELRAIATLTGLSSHNVAMWIGDRLRLKPSDPPALDDSTSDPSVTEHIEKYIVDANAKTCRSAHSEKARGGKYVCTWGCGYSTDQRDAWQRHEEKKQPQKFWHCVICRTAQKKNERHAPFIVHRPDKFLPHSTKSHPEENAEQLRTKSWVPYDAPFIKLCNFILQGTEMQCNHTFTSWKERNQHYFRHFEEASSDSSSHGPDDDNADDSSDNDFGEPSDYESNVEDEDSDFTNGGGSSEFASLPAPFSNTNPYAYSYGMASDKCQSGEKASCWDGSHGFVEEHLVDDSNTGCVTRESELPIDFGLGDRSSIPLAAHWLIHVETLQAVEAIAGVPYLALKYSTTHGATVKCLELSQTLLRPRLPPLEKLPLVFQKVFDLAKDLGFRYIWIDIFCGLKKNSGGIDAVYRQANLVLVIGHPSNESDHIWHFTCDYKNLTTIQSWAKQSVSFHHLQQLGHGAYGVVDKVELRPTHEMFARKTIFCTDSKNSSKAHRLQEIEVMRKFQHPHIARFVAAYFDHGTFNILMSPVADCDLRRYLAYPEQFTEKRKYLASWFLSLAEALTYIHGMRCRHKDIKPANILISGHTVLLTDFGTSFDFSTSRSTSIGGCMMTPKYCAPEVAAQGRRGRSADVFSLGCVFAEMITVEAGKSIADMNRCLNIREESTDRCATYHVHLEELLLWLQDLTRLFLDTARRTILQVSMAMLNRNPNRRPTARQISNALCSKKYCDASLSGGMCRCSSCELPDPDLAMKVEEVTHQKALDNSAPASLPTPPYDTEAKTEVKHPCTPSPANTNFATALKSEPDATSSLLNFKVPSFRKGPFERRVSSWESPKVAVFAKLAKECWRGVDIVPPVIFATSVSKSIDQASNNCYLRGKQNKSSVRTYRAATLSGSKLLSARVV